MAIIDQGVCKITHLNREGLGVGVYNGKKIILPYLAPGDVVSFQTHRYRGQENSIVLEKIEISENSINPECEYFTRCGGCSLQHLNQKTYHDFKLQLIESSLSQQGLVTHIKPLIIIPKGMRRRVHFAAVKKNDFVYMGFRRFHSHQIININACHAIFDELSSLITPIKLMLDLLLRAGQKADIFLLKAANGVDIIIVLDGEESLADADKLSLLRMAQDLKIIQLSIQYTQHKVLIYKAQEPYVVFDGIKVKVNYRNFLQSSSLSDVVLTNCLLQYINIDINYKIADLFCGLGTYTFPLSRYGQVDAFDLDGDSIVALKNAALENGRAINVTARDLFAEPLHSNELSAYDVVVINPPRAGAFNQIQQIANSGVKTIIYVSCNPATFAVDAAILCDNNYQLVELTPIDQFYWNSHIEIVALFVCL